MDCAPARLITALTVIGEGLIRRVEDDRPVTVQDLLRDPLSVESIGAYYAALEDVADEVLDPPTLIDASVERAATELLDAWRAAPDTSDVVLAFAPDQTSVLDRDVRSIARQDVPLIGNWSSPLLAAGVTHDMMWDWDGSPPDQPLHGFIVSAAPNARIFRIDKPEDAIDLIRCHPMERAPHTIIQEPDWAKVVSNFDAVIVTLAGQASAAGSLLWNNSFAYGLKGFEVAHTVWFHTDALAVMSRIDLRGSFPAWEASFYCPMAL